MQQDYFGFKRDKGGAKYGPQAGYTPSDYWSLYAASFAQDGSDDQLIAAMTKSVPDAWLKANGFDNADTLPDLTKNQMFAPGKFRPTEQSALDRSESDYMDMYSRNLQSRLRNDFKKNRKGMEDQGIANLRDQYQDALGEDIGAVDADASARGLLYSGVRTGNRARAAAQRANELGAAAGDYSRQLSDTERRLNSDVFASEMDSAFKQADMNDIVSGNFYNKLQRDLGATQGQAQAAMSLGDGLGSFSGALAGRLKKRQGSYGGNSAGGGYSSAAGLA